MEALETFIDGDKQMQNIPIPPCHWLTLTGIYVINEQRHNSP